MYPLGEPSNAAGDPGTIVATESEWTIVLLGGTNEIAVRHGDRQVFTRHRVGRRPVDAAISADQSSVFVANMFDDSASVIRLEDRELITTISLGTHPPPSLAQQGEVLFHDASLSLDRWYSCHSCHTDGHTNGLSNDNFGDTQAGAPKRVPSLLGTRDTGPWAWDGHQRELRNQIRSSILTTMQGEPERSATDENLRAIEAYLHTLTPPPGIDVARMRVADSRVAEGRLVFENRGCVDCHQASIFTSNDTYDIGMPDENGKRRFNPPSLLGVSQRDSYFHDGRVDTLRAAITDTPHGERFVLSGQEIEDLLAYLRSL
jgi:cytochrome c peroxidase